MTAAVARVDALPPGFPVLRDAALAEGWRMLRVLEEDWDAGAMRFAAPGEALFAAWRGGALAGIGGLTVDPYAEAETIGRLRRLYVAPPHRGRGLGRALVEAMLAHAAAHGFRSVRVRAPPAAGRFYEACGLLPAVLRSATHMRPL
ncbi:N-acetyltransferase [Roseomonas nepalensis]|uniref:N-acetyltransferase n=1 Tax=Muricoccus nepalensis TaxID=1854500 RepID=A0A502GJQ1_9PROT|nr:GNAT family N-acetyltransferase [Roseomonas nepalensis]TPG61023.1 N-acetyltransferase [Roseomonas nepalensis]